ncbi:MAG: PEP-CTERM sorting domain-containing protein [Planctomycetaceae bacterium]|nr:PEP-CTERM sorting domain-containing protein [Planctomycetaceae bacterium]
MRTTKNCVVGLALAVAFLVAANAQADIVSFTDKDAYMESVGASEWTFGKFTQRGDDEKAPITWDFTMSNQVGEFTGLLTMSAFSGNGGLMMGPTVDNDGVLKFHHNSANYFEILFDSDAFFDESFYLEFDPHSSWSSADKFVLTATYQQYGADTATTILADITRDDTFFGLALEGEAYLTSISFLSTTGTPNNGYLVTAGFSGSIVPEPAPIIPEPATLVMFGLGLAGLGVARRRAMKK